MAKWQKSFRAIPADIEEKLAALKGKTAVVGCAKKLSAKDIRDGAYKHLGIVIDKGKPSFPERVVPDASVGRASDYNANGREVIRKDLPMITKTYTFEAPNYGDWSNGSHDVSQDRDVYQREFVPPNENEISIELVAEEDTSDGKEYVFRFTLDQPLNIGTRGYKDELLRLLNLLQENVGSVDLFATDAKLDDYLKTIYVDWEILPPGERDTNIAKITAGVRNADDETKKRIADRYDFFDKMKPQALVKGHGGFRGYFGAQFSDELVAFENMAYGNAVYIMLADWKDASKRTKQDLLASGRDGKDFFRVVHGKGWKAQVKELVRTHRK